MAHFSGPAYAQQSERHSTPIVINGLTERQAFAGHFEALLDPAGTLGINDVKHSSAFQHISTSGIDFGYTKSVIWLRFDLTNASPNISQWRLHLRENFFQEFQAYKILPSGELNELENQTPLTRYSQRRFPYPELVVGFDLPPEQSATIYLRYRSGGSSELSWTLHSQDSFHEMSANKTAKNFIYYGMILLLSVAAILAFLATRSQVFLAYGIYAMSALLFVMHADGNAFQYIWPNLPLFNGFASIALGTAFIFFGSNFARVFLQTGLYHPFFNTVLLSLMGLAVAMLISSFFVDHQMLKKVLIMTGLITTLVLMASGLNAARTRFKEVRFYVVAWIGAVISAAIMTSRHWFGIEISEELQFDSMRIVLVSDAALMGLAIVDRFNQLKKVRSDALELSLTEAQRTLKLSSRLQELERDYALAQEIADSKERSFADTVHDLRQPLHALRLSVNAMAQDSTVPVQQHDIEDTFDYLEQLVQQELANATHPRHPVAREAEVDVATDLGDVLSNVHEMFLPDANAKNLTLTYDPTSARVHTSALAVMRIATNLVSNAIKYTDQGGIYVSVEQDDTHARLTIQDTGTGLSAAEWQLALTRSTRLTSQTPQEGSGLGLSIVQSLAATHNLQLEHEGDDTGTTVVVNLPIASDP